jgi:hypothetical protein
MSFTPPSKQGSWPVELDEAVDRLGEPEAVFAPNKSHIGWSIILGIISLTVGIVGIVCLIVFNLKIGAWIKFLIVVPAFGFFAIFNALRNRGMWVLVYPTGLLHWHRGVVKVFEWNEIRSISFFGVHAFGEPEIERDEENRIVRASLPIKHNSFNWGITLTRTDNETASISEYVRNSAELFNLIQVRTFELQWPNVLMTLQDHKECEFGPIRVSESGLLKKDDKLLPWDKFDKVKMSHQAIQFRQKGALRLSWWLTVAISKLKNSHVLLTLIATHPEWRARQAGGAPKGDFS